MIDYIVVYGNCKKERGIIVNALQDFYNGCGVDALIHAPCGARYTKGALENDLSNDTSDILIYNVDAHEMIPKLDNQLFKVRVDNG